jgi:hypothetical protein
MKEQSLMRDYLPDPPTPISIICPLGYFNTLAIFRRCSKASSKITRCILFEFDKLYSSKDP